MPHHRTQDSLQIQDTLNTLNIQDTHRTQQSKISQGSKNNSSRSTAPKPPRPPLINGHVLYPQDSTDTLVGSAFERKINEQGIKLKSDTTDRLKDLRRLMAKDKLDY